MAAISASAQAPGLDLPSSNSAAKLREQTAFWGLCALLTFSVLAFGAVEIWATSLLELGSCFLFVLAIIPLVVSGDIRGEKNPMLVPLGTLGASIGFQVVFHLTIYWYATYCAFLRYLCCAAVFLVAARLFKRIAARVAFAYFASLFGSAVALFAIFQDLSAHGALYWLHVPESPSHIFGPYANRNHYAGLMEMLAPFPFALALGAQKGRRELLLFGGALIVASIFLSGSRGGMLAFLFEAMFILVLSRPRPSRSQAVLFLGFASCVAALVYWLGSAELVSRLAPDAFRIESISGRTAIYRDSLRMVPEHWLIGWGAGTFAEVYPQYRSFNSDLLVNAVHNDYLQAFVETGLIGFVASMTFLAMMYRRSLRAVSYSNGGKRMITLAALTGSSGLLIHNLWDFNMQVPANAACLFVIIALASARDRAPK